MKTLKQNTRHLHTTIQDMLIGGYTHAIGDMIYGDTGASYGSYEVELDTETETEAIYIVSCYDKNGIIDTGYFVTIDKKDMFDHRYRRSMSVC